MRTSAIMLVLFCSVAFAEEQFAIQSIVGSYEGSVFSGDDMIRVQTSFSLGESGAISGQYVMVEDDGLEMGTLTNFLVESSYSASMTWADKYGSGILRVVFSEDYSSFVGFWGDDVTPASLPWNGTKKQRIT